MESANERDIDSYQDLYIVTMGSGKFYTRMEEREET